MITLTENAAKHINGYLEKRGKGLGVRLGVKTSGCSGMAYNLEFVDEADAMDTVFEAFGAKVIRAPQPVHGKTAKIFHDGNGLYANLPQPFIAGRYHSLIVDRDTLPDCMEITALNNEGLIMGLKHRHFNIQGVQFHPESILTPEGTTLLGNFLATIGHD